MGMSKILKIINDKGLNNIFFYGLGNSIPEQKPSEFESIRVQMEPVLFKIKDQDQLHDNSTITLKALQEGFYDQTMDWNALSDLIEQGQYQVMTRVNDLVDQNFIAQRGIDNLFLFSDTHPSYKILGIDIGPDKKEEPVITLFKFKRVKDDIIYFSSDNKDLWCPAYSFKTVNELNHEVGFDMILNKQDISTG